MDQETPMIKKHAHAAATPSANAGMRMSPEARARMRRRERDVFNYYDDMGPGKGNCTWGPGILAHKGACTKEELASPVSAAAVEAEFARRVDTGRPAEAASKIRAMTSTHVNGKKVVARGLISRREEESAPFQAAAKATATAKK
jgi:hypothetical protein